MIDRPRGHISMGQHKIIPVEEALAHTLSSIKLLLQRFDSFSCRHVYRENNKEADKASKEGIRLVVGTWTMKESIDGRTLGFYHRPFIEID